MLCNALVMSQSGPSFEKITKCDGTVESLAQLSVVSVSHLNLFVSKLKSWSLKFTTVTQSPRIHDNGGSVLCRGLYLEPRGETVAAPGEVMQIPEGYAEVAAHGPDCPAEQ